MVESVDGAEVPPRKQTPRKKDVKLQTRTVIRNAFGSVRYFTFY